MNTRTLAAIAVAGLLVACAQHDPTPVATEALSRADATATTDMPEVIITASREQPKSAG